jgi:fructose-1-phosphate kinase PfkB-like protein
MERKLLFTETLKAGGRVYFFDLREGNDGRAQLTITESAKNQQGEFEKRRLLISSEDFEPFSEALKKTLAQAQAPAEEAAKA